MPTKLADRRRPWLLALAGAAIIAGAVIAIATAPDADTKAHARPPAPRHALAGGARIGLTRTQLGAAAVYLGLSVSALRTRLRSGSSLAQIAAGTRGRSEHGLLAAVVKVRVARIEDERERGVLSAQRASTRIARVRRRARRALTRAGNG